MGCNGAKIDPGKFRWKLIIQEDTATSQNTYGEIVPSWAAIDTNSEVWGKIEQRGGRELLSGQQINPEVNAVVTIRHRSDLTPRNRLAVKGTSRVLEIVTMNDPDGTEDYLILGCRETQ